MNVRTWSGSRVELTRGTAWPWILGWIRHARAHALGCVVLMFAAMWSRVIGWPRWIALLCAAGILLEMWWQRRVGRAP